MRSNKALDGELDFNRISFLAPVGPWGTKVGAAYSDLRYQLGTTSFSKLKAGGNAQVQSLSAMHPFIRSRNTNLLGILQYDQRDFNDVQKTAGTDKRKEAGVAMYALSGDFRDRLLGGGINIFNIAHTKGRLSMNTADALAEDLHVTRGDYEKTNLIFSRLQTVSARMAMYYSYTQQWASKNLDASEKISLGGPSAVRAFPQGEGAGDEGSIGSVEMRYRLPVEESVPGSMVMTMFYDWGQSLITKNMTATEIAANTRNVRNIYGYGVGLNWEMPRSFYLKTSVAQGASKEILADHLKRSPLVYLQLSKYF